METVSLAEARRLAVSAQGLHKARPFGRGQRALEACIQHLGYVQIDTISVIRRSQHHCFWTRQPDYQEPDLDRLQKQRRVFEYWTHAAAYVPMQDYRYCLPYMHAIAGGQKHWRQPDPKAMAAVLERVRTEGPLKAQDFEHPPQRTGAWGWNWKPAKIALEQLFIEGQLVVSHREGFQKVYDLPERVLPENLDTTLPSTEEFHRYLILSTLRAHGLATEGEFSYLRKGLQAGIRQCLQSMLEAGELVALRVESLDSVWYSTPAQLEGLPRLRVRKSVHLLSPFDNFVIKRARIQQLFGSDYKLECFVPAKQRRFGYFCLPILYGTELIGRLDPKADRRRGVLLIQSFQLERDVPDMERCIAELAAKLQQLAEFNDCTRVDWHPKVGDRAGHLLAQHLQG